MSEIVCRPGSDDSMPAFVSAGPGLDTRRDRKFLLILGARRGGDVQFIIARLYVKDLD